MVLVNMMGFKDFITNIELPPCGVLVNNDGF